MLGYFLLLMAIANLAVGIVVLDNLVRKNCKKKSK